MAKAFFEVFPTLKVEGELHDLLQEAEVTHVSTNRAHSLIRVYLCGHRLIFKKNIWRLEHQIKEQLFANQDVAVTVIEKFELSAQYDPRSYYEAYKDSIHDELYAYNPLEYNLLRMADMDFSKEKSLTLTLEDKPVAHNYTEDITRFLEKVFCERGGMDLVICVRYKDPVANQRLQTAKQKVAQEVRQIAENANLRAVQEEQEAQAAKEEFLSEDNLPGDGDGAGDAESTGSVANKKSASKNSAHKKLSANKGSNSNQNHEEIVGNHSDAEELSYDNNFDHSGSSSGGYSNGTASSSNHSGEVAASNSATSANKGKSASRGGKSARNGNYRRKYEPGSTGKPQDPNMIYGKPFEGDPMEIAKIDEPIGDVTIHGQILSVEVRDVRNEHSIIRFAVTDFTDTIMVKLFIRTEQKEELLAELKKDRFVRVSGQATIDHFDNDLLITNVRGIRKGSDFRKPRMDTAPVKRVELHCHTKMSDMDAVSDVGDIIACAREWGMSALAVTDHGNVQAFPDADHAAAKDFKVIYGVEAYLVDDLKEIVTDSDHRRLDASYVVFDLETTGFSPDKDRIIEIGAVKVVGGEITDRFSEFVNPERPIPFRIEKLTSIRDDMVMGAPTIETILPRFLEFCDGCAVVAHNADFDTSFIKKNAIRQGITWEPAIVDTVSLARVLMPQLKRYKLDTVAKGLGVVLDHHHRAVDDAECTALIFQKFVQMLAERDIYTLDEVNALVSHEPEAIRKLPTYHAIILATCEQGRTNLYHLISESHLVYYAKQPRVPKSLFLKYRDGLLIGSACEAGELYRAILGGRPEEEIARLADFYDYFEIQPIGNNEFMIRDEDSSITSVEDLQDINRRIVRLGEEWNKPVVATCDAHFLHPEDEIYRRIIQAGKGFKDSDEQPPLYLRTTEEMLREFDYLGPEKAEEVVITNTNLIADMCERMSPVRPDKCPPVIEDSDRRLREICERSAHELYGDVLPPIVEERLERELNSIISNGYAVMYIIAQRLVWKSNEDGYLVGSRGSVGSSFAATMAGITEVNPLHAHYVCPNCKYSDFDSDIVKSFSGRSGCDMPDCNCPKCGTKMKKLGFDIPFETFLGFKGNKEPDIDLNFSGEYQSKAHKYTEVIFGEGQTYKAGTIGTLADKTAFGYVKNYFEDRKIPKRTCEIDRIVSGCVGIRRTTGQHPGGIVVLPIGEDINTFTPVQHPANDMTVDIVTTHFDYHKIEHNLLKLDILGHDDPTMIRMLQDLTGVDPHDIPLDDKKVMSLFQNTSALGITPDDIRSCQLGALGIPEFGTDFAMGMLIDTHPKELSDLVRIAGLAHGTDVWLGNAQKLIMDGTTDLAGCICTRDDIMLYLIDKGLESEKAFTIMESVRKGKGLKPEWEEDMLAHGVPDWYIWSCKKIKYMFPKAHAAAYVMMAWRIAYCKVYYPLAYYAAYFSIRATGFSYEMMCQGRDRLEYFMDDLESRKDNLSKKEQDIYKDARVVEEMYARGFEFTPMKLGVAQSHRFQIIDGKLMASYNSIDGLGDTAAVSIAEAVKDGPFLSKDDFRDRTKVSKNITDLMGELGILGDIPESNQMSLFDL